MQCTELNLYTYSSPFISPVRTSIVTMYERKVLVIGVVINDQEYFAELNSFETPWYHYETIETSITNCKRIFAKIKGQTITSTTDLQHYLNYETPNASSAFDYISIQYFNTLKNVTVPIGQTLHHGVTTFRRDASRIKLKFHESVLQQVKNIRKKSEIPIVIDANGTLTERHFDLIQELDAYDIAYFEEPFKEITLYEKFLNKNPNVQLAIDEQATSAANIEKYRDVGVTTAVIKYSRLGGITAALSLNRNMTYISGGMYEYGLSKYATAMLGEQFKTIPDITPKGTYFKEDFSVYGEYLNNGQLTIEPPKVDRMKLRRL